MNEDGTEARAVQLGSPEVSGGFGPPPIPPIPVKFDRPFLFAIHHMPTGALVYLGAVMMPEKYVKPTTPLLTPVNAATIVPRGATGQLTALETPGDTGLPPLSTVGS